MTGAAEVGYNICAGCASCLCCAGYAPGYGTKYDPAECGGVLYDLVIIESDCSDTVGTYRERKSPVDWKEIAAVDGLAWWLRDPLVWWCPCLLLRFLDDDAYGVA